VLSKSLITNELKSHKSFSTCYFFFKDNEEQNSLLTALCLLLHQLFDHQPQLLHHTSSYWDRNGEKLLSETGQLWRILLSAAMDLAASDVVCVRDALDECTNERPRDLISFLVEFYNSQMQKASRQSSLKFLLTSRPYYDIEHRFPRIMAGIPIIRLAGEVENDQTRAEINLVIKTWISDLSNELGLQPGFQNLLQTRLEQKKQRTCLWLYLVLEEIPRSLKRTERNFNSIVDEIRKSVRGSLRAYLEQKHGSNRGENPSQPSCGGKLCHIERIGCDFCSGKSGERFLP
jgi:hypothetical protein